MTRYDDKFKASIRRLRQRGLTYTEIQKNLRQPIPKTTLSYICRGLKLSPAALRRIKSVADAQLALKRQKALVVNQTKLQNRISSLRKNNQHINSFIKNRDAKLIALAMLYLGEGAKWRGRRGLLLGSSDPQIVTTYIALLEQCYEISKDKLKARIQHRADQDPVLLTDFWVKTTGIDIKNFYPCYIDKRTIGRTTLKKDYRGVCAISCAGTHIQLELEQVAGIINDALRGYSSVD